MTPAPTSISPARGIVLSVLGGLLLTLNDGTLKWLTGDYPVGQLMFMRGVFVCLPVALIVWRAGGLDVIRFRNWRNQLPRAVFAFSSGFLFITGISFLPLADAIAITFAGPLFITALAPWMLGEEVGWRRWAAVLVGLAAVLVMVRPTGAAIHWAAFFPLVASLFGALRDLWTRKIAGVETSMSILVFTTLTVAFLGLLTAPFGWTPIRLPDLGLMALSGMFVGGAHFCLIDRFRWAEAALLAPFKYVNMVWAVAIGFVLFADLPDGWTLGAAAVVVASGIYIARRESELARAKIEERIEGRA